MDGGPEKENVQNLINSMGLDEYFYLPGYVENMKEAYAALDIVAIPSLREGLPNVLLEAMACGKPVIAAKVGGIPGVITDRNDGFLVPSGDSRAIADVMDELSRSAELRNNIGFFAKRKIGDRFNFDHTLAGIQKVYEAVFRHGRPGK